MKSCLLRRPLFGQYENITREFNMKDIHSFSIFLRMDPPMFQEILARISPRIEKHDTFFRNALIPSLKLAATLRYLATGCSYRTLQYSFRVSVNTISNFIPEVYDAIVEAYSDDVMSCTITSEEWLQVAHLFGSK